MVTVKYAFVNPRTVVLNHRYLFHCRKFHSFEEAKKFVDTMPLSMELKIFEGKEEFVTNLETNCYIIHEGKKFPQIQGEFYDKFETLGSKGYFSYCDYYTDFDKNLRMSNYTLPKDYIDWFIEKFIKRK